MDEQTTPPRNPEGGHQHKQPEKPRDVTEVTMLSYEPDTVVEHVYQAWCQQFQTVPRMSIRGDVDFIEPGRKPGTWKKKRTVYLKEWYRVKAWQHDHQGRMLIAYTFIGSPSHRQQRTQDQWVRPTTLFDTWSEVQLRRDVAAEDHPDLKSTQEQK